MGRDRRGEKKKRDGKEKVDKTMKRNERRGIER
jgi:hypothetical protein